jgi:hypothetical protein
MLSASLGVVRVGFLLIALWIVVNIGFFGALMASAASGQTVDPGAIGIGIFWLFFNTLIFMFFLYVLIAAYEAACLRWMIHGEQVGFLGLSLGAPTWRVYSGYWIWFLIQMGIGMVVGLLSMPFMFMFIGSVGVGGDPTAAGFGFIIYQLVTTFVQYGIMAFVGVRFAPAAATSIALRRFAFFDAWKVTKGRFWALFGSFFLVMLVYLIIVLALFAVGAGALFPTLLPIFTTPNPSPDQVNALMTQLFAPQMLIALGAIYAVSSLMGVVYAVLMYGINARAVEAAIEDGKITGVTPGLAETFS